MGYSPWGCKESDTTEQLTHTHTHTHTHTLSPQRSAWAGSPHLLSHCLASSLGAGDFASALDSAGINDRWMGIT